MLAEVVIVSLDVIPTYQLDNERLLRRGDTTTNNGLALSGQVEEQRLELFGERVSQGVAIDDNGEGFLSAWDETTLLEFELRRTENGSDLVQASFNLELRTLERVRGEDHNLHVVLEQIAAVANLNGRLNFVA